MLAVRSSKLPAVEALLEAGADAAAQNQQGSTAVRHWAWACAYMQGRLRFGGLHMDLSLQVACKPWWRMLPRLKPHPSCCQLCMQAHLAAVNGKPPICSCLAQRAPAALAVRNAEGKTAAEVAKTPEVAALLAPPS